MNGCCSKYSILLIIRTMIVSKRIQQLLALSTIKPTSAKNNFAACIPSSSGSLGTTRKFKPRSYAISRLLFPDPQFPHLNIMRGIMCPIQISFLIQDTTIMGQTFSTTFITINYVDCATYRLCKDDDVAIANT